MRILVAIMALATCVVSSVAQAQRVAPVAFSRTARTDAVSSELVVGPPHAMYAGTTCAMPAWLKWGLIGAGAGAVTFPLLGSTASDSRSEPAKDAVAGAAVGFVIVGGGVALWQAVCGPDSSSRRAGLCGR
jgi:hypothetical protein